MIPILTADQIRQADAYTIAHEPVASIDLMERAAMVFVSKLLQLELPHNQVVVFCGIGNNGGDGLAVARMLRSKGFRVRTFIVGNMEKGSPDFQTNLNRLSESDLVDELTDIRQFPMMTHDTTVIDALFGSGLNRPVAGLAASVIDQINEAKCPVISIDIPSGLFADQPTAGGSVIYATHTISFELPKLAFFQPSLYSIVGEWHLVPIGLDQNFIQNQTTQYFLTEASDIQIPVRARFAHKGQAGRMLLIAGSKGKMGAVILSARAAMRSGGGLLFVHCPSIGLHPLQIAVPEAQVITDVAESKITNVRLDNEYQAIAIGPGIGTDKDTKMVLQKLLEIATCPLVLDADALNLLADNPTLLTMLPPETILTPHPGEFRRLVGEWQDDFQKLEILRKFSQQYRVNVVLKGAYSAVSDSAGRIFFNPSGNPGMATAGSGDVLTGIIGGLLAQGLTPFEALRSAVYLHGQAGDLAKQALGEVPMIASDLVDWLPKAIRNSAGANQLPKKG